MPGLSTLHIVYRISSTVGLERGPWRAPVGSVGGNIPRKSSKLVICGLGGLATLFLALESERARAQDPCAADPTFGGCELVLPPVCSRDPLASTAAATMCEVTTLPRLNGYKRVQVNLTAQTERKIQIGGYTVETDNYNGSYLPPVVEAIPGD